MPHEQCAILYRGKKKTLAYPMNRIVHGGHLESEPYLVVEGDDPIVLGAAVRGAIEAFKPDIPAPGRDGYAPLQAIKHKAAGVTSQAAFIRDARMVYVTKNERFILVPSRNQGVQRARGCYPIEEKRLEFAADADDLTLGTMCARALALCD